MPPARRPNSRWSPRPAAATSGRRTARALPPELLHTVYYDDLVADTRRQMELVFRFLGVEPMQTTSDFVKTSRNNLSNKIENYKEVRQALRGTPWEIP